MAIVSLQTLGLIFGTVVLVWTVPRTWQPFALAVATAFFLLYKSPVSFAILLPATLLVYFSLQLKRSGIWVAGIVILIFSLLIWHKSGLILDINDPSYAVIPLGLSYYALRLIHYAIETWKNKLPEHSLSQFLCYMWFLPTLSAGPINRFPEFARSLRRRRWDPQLFSRGLERILYGYVKIILLGNYLISLSLAKFIEQLSNKYPGFAEYLDCARYGLNLYFQFSGYSDIAIGFALLLGFEVLENFSYPFFARNINEFWNRWHISLSQWCRGYIFMPVLSVTRSPRFGVLASMIVLALWHELSWRYLAWGIYHGLGIAIWQRWTDWRQNIKRKMPSSAGRIEAAFSWALTMNFVLLSFVFTKEVDLAGSYKVISAIFGWGG